MAKHTVYFDLETTGLGGESRNSANIRIIEIAAIKVDSETLEEVDKLYYKCNNDGIKIDQDAFERHGISEEELVGLPTFRSVAKDVYKFFEGCDVGGYYCTFFDIPILYESFLREGINWNYRTINVYDVYFNYKKYHSTKLGDVYTEYTGKTLDHAHEAEADIRATLAIYEKQKEKGQVFLDEDLGILKNNVDIAGNFKMRETSIGSKEIYVDFGKWKGHAIDKVDVSYFKWMMGNESFATDTRLVAKKIYEKYAK